MIAYFDKLLKTWRTRNYIRFLSALSEAPAGIASSCPLRGFIENRVPVIAVKRGNPFKKNTSSVIARFRQSRGNPSRQEPH